MSTRTSSGRRALGAIGLGLLLLMGVGVVRGQGAADGRGKILGDRKCFLCHQDHKESFAASIHGGLGGEEDSTYCETCHGPGEKHVVSGGEVEFIIRFDKLDPAAASRKCMACHEKLAPESSHIRGFLESSYLAKGLGCNSCHQAHAAKVTAAPEAAPEPPKTIGEAACLVCHSDYRDYGHRPHVAEALACETCHGPGRAHAEARGDPALIRNPEKLEAPASDRSCMMCHSDFAAPEHFKPEPGKTRCVDCHEVHPEAGSGEAVAAETPGAPPFRLELDEGAAPPPAPATAGNRLRLPVLPAAETEGGEYYGVVGAGVIRFGGRYTNVNGNEDIYEQDWDLQSGFRLFDFDLSMKSAKNPGTQFRIAGEGSGDPVQHYLLDFRQEDLFAVSAKYTQTRFVHLASGDPRDWNAKRRNFGADVTFLLGGGFRLSGGVDYWRREGGFEGGFLVAGQSIDGEEPFDESGTYAWARLDWGDGPWSLSLTQGYRWEEFEDDVSAGKFFLPTDRTLESERETEVTGPMTTVLAEWKAAKTVTLDGRLLWAPLDTDTDYDAQTTGPGGGTGFIERTQGTVSGDRDTIRGEVGATWLPAEDWTVYARLEGFRSDDETSSVFRTSREDPPTSTPADSVRKEEFERDHSRLRVRGEVRWQATDWMGLLGGFEWMTEEYTVKENGVKDDYDADILGPVLGFDIQPVKDLDIDFLYRFTKVNDAPYTQIGPRDVDNIRLRARWRATDELKFNGYARRSLLTNPRHDTRVHSWGAGVGGAWMPFEEIEIDASYDYQQFETETEVIRYVGSVPEEGLSEYFARTHGGHVNVLWRVAPEVRLVGRFHSGFTTGDYETGWMDVSVGGEWDVIRQMTLGADGRYVRFHEQETDVDDYSAYIIEFWVRVGF